MSCARMSEATRFAEEGQVGRLRIKDTGPDASRALLAETLGYPSRTAKHLRWGPLGFLAKGEPWQAGRVAYLAHFIHLDVDGNHHPVSPSTEEEQAQLLVDLEKELQESLPEADARFLGLSPGRFVISMARVGNWLSASPVTYQYTGFLQRVDPVLRAVLEHLRFQLEFHPINELRLDLGEAPISSAWCWSGGHRIPEAPALQQTCSLFSPDPFVRGLAAHSGIPFHGMGDPYLEGDPLPLELLQNELREQEEVIIWIPAPFASERFQEPQEKVRRLDQMDYRLLSPIRKVLQEEDRVRFLLAAAGVRHRGRPERGSAPFVLWEPGSPTDTGFRWTEADGLEGSLGAPKWGAILETFRKSS